MARAYSDDLRRKLLEAHRAGKGILAELAERFGVSDRWAWKISSEYRRTGSMARTPQRRHGRLADPGAGEPEAGHRFARVTGRTEGRRPVDQHPAPVAYRAQDGSAAQKKSLHAGERDTPANRLQRQAFVAELATIAPEDLIYLDESGVSTQRTRPYARAPRGQRVHAAVPGGNWKMLTILGAMDHQGMLAAMTVEAATDREVFLAYLENVLCPKLRPGHVIVMDNLSAHKVEGVRERIEAMGARLLYLPPYSPDLHPIEKLWSKLKQGLQNAAARTA